MHFQRIQMKDAIPRSWKEIVKQGSNVNKHLLSLDHLVIFIGVCL